MDIWIPATVIAAFLQNLRSAGQKHLKGVMGTSGATFVRFGFGAPFAVLYLFLVLRVTGAAVPAFNPAFVGWVAVGGFTQIAATYLLVHLFSFRNFAIGTAYSRTEPAQAVILGGVLLAEVPTVGALAAVAISVLGVMLISVAHTKVSLRSLFTSLRTRSVAIGLTSGLAFAASAVAYRAASLSLAGSNFIVQATITLACVILFQAAAMLVWLLWRERDELARIRRAWKPSLFVGFVGATASLCWFTAMTVQQAAVVKALGQVEMIFAFAFTVFVFRERINRFEAAGCLLIVLGILILVLL
ncbi:EamA family transporter [Pseudochelatococcus lubricantis]|nr:EamA family transporter [Pseudochelatococcus lubricantis]